MAPLNRLVGHLTCGLVLVMLTLGPVLACDVCTGIVGQSKQCSSQTQNCLILECDILGGFWYLAPNSNNATIGTSAGDVRLPNYKIETIRGNNRLNITFVNQQNYGIDRFLTLEPDKVDARWCYFSLFVYGKYLVIYLSIILFVNN